MHTGILQEPQVIFMSGQMIELQSKLNTIEKEKSEIKKKTQDEIFNALTSTLGEISKTKNEQIVSFDIVRMTKEKLNDGINK